MRLRKKASELHIPVITTYAMTETASNFVTTPYADRFKAMDGAGVPNAGVEVREVAGALEVRTPALMLGYWGRDRVRSEDWFATGDMGWIDEDGQVHVRGRSSEMMITGGENVYPSEIEQQIETIPGIRACRIIGMPDDVWGVIVTALLVPQQEPLPEEGLQEEQLREVTLEQALAHPNWSMGRKITVDSATMVNKGLEVIEAKWLFDVPLDDIQVVVHPQSVLHSAVEFCDCSVIGQMGQPDMRVPIAYAFSYPERLELGGMVSPLDFFSLEEGLTFMKPDLEVFRTIAMAYEASRRGGSYPVVLNGANEVLVDHFLKGRIRFIDIQETLEKLLEEHVPVYDMTLEQILEEDRKIRRLTEKTIEEMV